MIIVVSLSKLSSIFNLPPSIIICYFWLKFMRPSWGIFRMRRGCVRRLLRIEGCQLKFRVLCAWILSMPSSMNIPKLSKIYKKSTFSQKISKTSKWSSSTTLSECFSTPKRVISSMEGNASNYRNTKRLFNTTTKNLKLKFWIKSRLRINIMQLRLFWESLVVLLARSLLG